MKKIAFNPKESIAAIARSITYIYAVSTGMQTQEAELAGNVAQGIIKGWSFKDSPQVVSDKLISIIKIAIKEMLSSGNFELPDNCEKALLYKAFSPQKSQDYLLSDNPVRLLEDAILEVCSQAEECDIETLPIYNMAFDLVERIDNLIQNDHELANISILYTNKEILSLVKSIHSLLSGNSIHESSPKINVTKKIKSVKSPTIKTKWIGRDQNVNEIHTLFEQTQHVILLNGLGGIGKTELSKQYFNDMKKLYSTLFWFDYNTDIKHTLAKQSAIWENEHYYDYSIDYYYEKVLNYLINQNEDTLIIIDNVDNSRDKYLNDLTRLSCKVLINSRQKIYGFKEYTVGFLSLENCMGLFKMNYGQWSFPRKEEKLIRDIVKLAGYHTLAIELLAKTVSASPTLTIQLLYSNLIEHGFDLSEMLHSPVPVNWHDDLEYRRFFEHLLIVFDIASLEKQEQKIMVFLSILPNDKIEMETFSALFNYSYQDDIEKLNRKGWLTIRAGKIIIHNIVQEIIRHRTKPTCSNCEELIDALVRITESGTTGSLDNKFDYTDWIISVANYIIDFSKPFISLLNNTAWLLSEKGDNKKAIQIQQLCLTGVDRIGVCQELKIGIYNVFSLLLTKDLTCLHEALAYQKKSLILRKKAKQSPYISYHNIALIYGQMNLIKSAIKMEMKVYEHEKATSLSGSPEFAVTLSCLSNFYKKAGDLNKAFYFQNEALAIRRLNNKDDKFRLAKSCYSIAILHDLNSNSSEATQYYLETIQLLNKLNIYKPLQLALCYLNLYFITSQHDHSFTYKEHAISYIMDSAHISIKAKRVNWDKELAELRKQSLKGDITF